MKAESIIRTLHLAPHPEGGFFRETYRSRDKIDEQALPGRYAGSRAVSTGIYFLLTGDTFSAFHRLRSDEVWHYYSGATATLHLLHENGNHETLTVGPDVVNGEFPQVVIPHGCWFAAKVNQPEGYILLGCTVAPGFDFADFELADRNHLIECYPSHCALITEFTRIHHE